MIHLLELIYFLLLIVAALRCLYFWQLKEYRLDRFREFLKTKQRWQFLLPSRWFLRPRITLKILLLVYLTLCFSIYLMDVGPQLLALVLTYLLIPVTVSLSVFILAPLSSLLTDIIILAARLKLSFFRSRLKVIGITGSYGKTATKEILCHVLKAKYRVCHTPGTNNTLIGVALTILKSLRSRHQIFVVEMGAYKRGEIKAICNLVKPQIGILTGINSQHLGLFGSLENIIAAKLELLQALPPSGLAVINGDNKITRSIAAKFSHCPKIIYHSPKEAYQTNLLGDFQQLNLEAAALVARKLQVPLKLIKLRLQKIPRFKTTLSKKIGLNGATIIDSTYNANPDGFLAAIKYLQSLNFKSKIMITSGIIELGKNTNSEHQRIGRLGRTVFEKIYLTKPELIPFFPGAVFSPDPKKIIPLLKKTLNRQTVVLLISRLPAKFISALC